MVYSKLHSAMAALSINTPEQLETNITIKWHWLFNGCLHVQLELQVSNFRTESTKNKTIKFGTRPSISEIRVRNEIGVF